MLVETVLKMEMNIKSAKSWVKLLFMVYRPLLQYNGLKRLSE